VSSSEKAIVLIVDDSLMVCRQVQLILEKEDLELVEAHTGQEAIEILDGCQPDLILLDVVLPDMEGYDLCQQIKKRSQAAVMFLTSKDSDKDVVKGFSMGACDYIKKPFGKEELRSRVITHLQMKRQQDELNRMNKELQMNMERLNYMAYRDGLTGLYNRRYVKNDLMEELRIKRQNWENLENIVMIADVDDFKKVNDRYGHEAGDMVLVCVSNIMEEVCKRHKVIRWGGEEFMVVLFSVTKDEGYEIGEKIRQSIEEFPFVYDGLSFHCTITIGMSCYGEDMEMDENFVKADKALYYGKKHGKNQCVWYEPQIEVEK
jgi:two-component system cell cycle response regulator